MALKSIVLHLGAHKTGTSLVQKFTRSNARRCRLAQIWPMRRSDGSRLIGSGGAEEIALGTEAFRAQIAMAEARGYSHFLLSYENALGHPFRKRLTDLYPEAHEKAVLLRNMIGDRPIRVIFYIRNQPDFIESYYLQTVHQGKHHSFAVFQATLLKNNTLSWRPLYDALCDVFGAGNVVIHQFENQIADGQSAYLRQFFTSAIGKSPYALGRYRYEKIHNPSIGDRGLELALEFNKHLKTPQERKSMRRFLQENFSNRDYPRPHLLSEEAKKELTERFAAENAQIVEEAEQAAAFR